MKKSSIFFNESKFGATGTGQFGEYRSLVPMAEVDLCPCFFFFFPNGPWNQWQWNKVVGSLAKEVL